MIGQATSTQPKRKGGLVDTSAAGSLLTVDPTKTHIAVLGGTGGGKTASSAFHMAYMARRHNYHIIVLDGKGGIDWKDCDGAVEWHKLTPANLYEYMAQIIKIYQTRSAYLENTAGVKNIYQDPQKRYQPIFLMIEEFGNTWRKLPEAKRSEIETWMDELFSMGRACGIIMCLIDQAPQKWSSQMIGNAKFSLVYEINGGVAGAFHEYYAEQLQVGFFSRNNTFYRAWHVAEEVDLPNAFAPQPKRMLKPVADAVLVADAEAPVRAKRLAAVPVAQSVEQVTARTPRTVLVGPLAKIYAKDKEMRKGKWDRFGEKFFQIYPDAQMIELAEAMSLADFGDTHEDNVNARKSTAQRIHERFAPSQQQAVKSDLREMMAVPF